MIEIRGEFIRYAMASALSAVASFSIPLFLVEVVGLAALLAVGISFFLVFCMNFLTMRLFVFKSSNSRKEELARFAAVSLAFRGSEYVAFSLLHVVLGMHYLVALALVLGVSLLAKFFVQRNYVYRRRPAT